MNQIIRIGMDTSKHFFQLHGVDAAERPVLRRKLRRNEILAFFAKQPPTIVGMEACGGVALLGTGAVQARPRGEADRAAAREGLHQAQQERRARCRGTMRGDELADDAVRPGEDRGTAGGADADGGSPATDDRRTQLSNAIRGYAAEFGLITAKGLDKVEPLLAQIAQDESLPALAREMFALQGRDYARLQVDLKAIEARLMAWHRANADSRRLAKIPGIGPIGASALVMKAPDPRAVPVRPAFCRLDRADAERSFHRRQDPARQDHPRRR